jgi:hypothetical protein
VLILLNNVIYYGAGKYAQQNFTHWLNTPPDCFVDADERIHYKKFITITGEVTKYDILPLNEAVVRYPNYMIYITTALKNYKPIKKALIEQGIPRKRIKYILSGDSAYLSLDVPMMKTLSNWYLFINNNFNHRGMKILEIGSRNVTGFNVCPYVNNADYIGFDYHAGDNVNIVGDAHKLSSYFEKNEKFDLIFSSAVF